MARETHRADTYHRSIGSNGVAIASNWRLSADGTGLVVWSPESGGGGALSYGSNANDISSHSAAGASALVTRADHIHRGVRSVSHSSNTYFGNITLIAGAGMAITSPATGSFELISSGSGGGAGGGAGTPTNITGTYDIEGDGTPTYTDAGMSDEFNSGTIDGQWTVVGAGAGTVSLITANPAASVYDLGTRSGDMLVQVDIAGSVAFRQDAVLANGEQIIVAMSIAAPGDAGSVGNSMWAGIGFNTDNTDYDAGTIRLLVWDGADDHRIISLTALTPTITGEVQAAAPLGRQYFRVVRSADVLYWFWSVDGVTWTVVGDGDSISTCDNFWIFFDSKGVSYDHAPISAVMWVRHVANTNFDPW